MDVSYPTSHGHSRILKRDCLYLDLVSKLRRRLRRALFFVGSCHYSNNYTNVADNNHVSQVKAFNQSEKILESEPILYVSGINSDFHKSNLLAMRLDQLGNRNRQLLANVIATSRRQSTDSSLDTIDGKIAHLVDQVKQLYY